MAKIIKLLDEMYPNPKVPLLHRNAWELLVATILSAQCTDKRVNEVTPGLFAKYPTPRDFAAENVMRIPLLPTGRGDNEAPRALVTSSTDGRLRRR